jgi:hypothetical protein
MRRALLVLAAALALASPAFASPKAPDEAAILAAVDRFFAALKDADSKALAEVTMADGMITANQAQGDGTYRTRRFTAERWMKGLAGRPGFDEQIHSPQVLQRGPMAVVWAPYRIVGMHCGYDAIDMIRTEGGWKVANLMWTAEPAACEELAPKGKSKP